MPGSGWCRSASPPEPSAWAEQQTGSYSSPALFLGSMVGPPALATAKLPRALQLDKQKQLTQFRCLTVQCSEAGDFLEAADVSSVSSSSCPAELCNRLPQPSTRQAFSGDVSNKEW